MGIGRDGYGRGLEGTPLLEAVAGWRLEGMDPDGEGMNPDIDDPEVIAGRGHSC